MKFYFYILIALFTPALCLAQDADSSSIQGSSGSTSQIIAPPPPPAVRIDPCGQGQCDYGKRQRKKRGFGSKRGKALSKFGKTGNKKKSRAIDGGHRRSKARGMSHFSFKHH